MLAGMGFGAAQALQAEQERKLREFQVKQAAEIAQAQLAQRQAEAQAAQAERAQMRQLELDKLTKIEDADAQSRRGMANMAGLVDMGLDPQTARREATGAALRSGDASNLRVIDDLFPIKAAPKLRSVTVRGPQGQPINRMVPETEEVEEYREPKGTGTPAKREPLWVKDANGNVIDLNKVAPPGSQPYDSVAERQAAKTENVHPQILEYSRDVIRKIDDLIGREDDPSTPDNEALPNRITNATAGVGGAIRRWSPFNNSAKDVDAELFSLTSGLALSALQKMRASSQTGGAVGNVALGEMEIMKNAEAAIRSDQSPRNLKRQLGIIRESERRFLETVEKDQRQRDPGLNRGITAAPGTDAELAAQALIEKARAARKPK